MWIGLIKIANCRAALFGNQVLKTPRVVRFIDLHFMSSTQQLGRDATQKVRIAVIPVRHQRLIEHCYAHAARSPSAFSFDASRLLYTSRYSAAMHLLVKFCARSSASWAIFVRCASWLINVWSADLSSCLLCGSTNVAAPS